MRTTDNALAAFRAASGVVPVVLSDDWVLPFDELIEYSELVVRVRARARRVFVARVVPQARFVCLGLATRPRRRFPPSAARIATLG